MAVLAQLHLDLLYYGNKPDSFTFSIDTVSSSSAVRGRLLGFSLTVPLWDPDGGWLIAPRGRCIWRRRAVS